MNKAFGNGKRILCLINAAAYARPYFEQLAVQLRGLGHEVFFVLDSHLSDVLYAGDQVLEGARYFTDFTRQRLAAGGPAIDPGDTRWSPLFSDFDRFATMRIAPPLDSRSALQYEQVPALLREFFLETFDTCRPDAIVYEPVSNSFAIAAYECASNAGIPFLSLSPSRIPGRIEVSVTGALRDNETIREIYRGSGARRISEESRAIARNYCAEIDSKVPDYMKTNGLDHVGLAGKYLKWGKIAHFLRGWRYSRRYKSDCALAYQHGNPVRLSVAYFRRSLERRLRHSAVARHYGEEVAGENYLLYPLHFHPEASTSVASPDFVDEIAVIKALAFRLPTGVKLYVKEHPSAVALQPVSFYEQLSCFPNVRLLGPGRPTKTLVRNSRGVVCLTSTVGFEAAVLNKPVLVLGNVFYSYFPNVRQVGGYSEMTAALDWALAYRPLTEAELIEATAAYVEFTAPGSFDFRVSLGNAKALEAMARLIDSRLATRQAAAA
jgi:hypothetical protein